MKQLNRILAATNNEVGRTSILQCFENEFGVDYANDFDEAVDLLKKGKHRFIFLDLNFVDSRDASCFGPFLALSPKIEIIILCMPDTVRDAVRVVRHGANSYLIHPVDPAEIRYVVESTYETEELREQIDLLRNDVWQSDISRLISTKSRAMSKILGAAQSVSQTDTTVILTGETGTGKGVLAKLIHEHSKRSDKPFIDVHCGAIPENLVESELFGHEKGAFTGATSQKAGKFEAAQGGTIFLDEIGTMTQAAQVRLLKVLQEREYQRVGGQTRISADVRVIAAANRDLLKMCEQGEFRYDLYYRLSVFPIELPPLRDRAEDIPGLVELILKKLNTAYGKNIAGIREPVLRALEKHTWPGNIRELENVIERAYVLETTAVLSAQSFPQDIAPIDKEATVVAVDVAGTLADVRKTAIEMVEEHYLREKLTSFGGRIDRTAEAAGITSRQLHKLMTKYKLRKEHFRQSGSIDTTPTLE